MVDGRPAGNRTPVDPRRGLRVAFGAMAQEYLVVRGAREHNLKNISVAIPRNQLTVITGLSGSGKSSLAFDTIYAEGQRRYVESLSAYARQFLGLMEKPDVDAIEGLSPAISIEQKTTGQNPRSTVGTVTEIYDYLRLLWARVGVPHCPNDGTPVTRQSAAQITDTVLGWPEETRIEVLAPLVRGRKGEFRDLLDDVRKRGFVRVRVDGETYDLGSVPALNRRQNHDIAIVVDRLVVRAADRSRLNDSIETALKTADGLVEVVRHEGRQAARSVVFSERFACPVCGLSLPELEPRQFSFNSPFGVCPDCHGLGTRREVNADLVLGDPSISILEGVILPWGEPSGYLRKVVLPTLAKAFKFDLNAPWGEHSESGQAAHPARRAGPLQVPDRWRPGQGRVRERLGGRAPQRRAPLPRVQQRRGAGDARGVHDRAALPDLRGKAAQARESSRCWCTARASATWWTCRSSARSSSSRAFRCAGADGGQWPAGPRSRHRGTDPQGGGGPAALPARCRARVPDARPGRHLAVRAARPSGSGSPPRSARGWSACSTSWTSRASACISGTTSGCSPRCAVCATWATRSSWSSTTRTPSRRPTTSSIWARARAASAGEVVAEGTRRGYPAPSRLAHRALSAGRAADPGARPAGARLPPKHRLRVVGAKANNLEDLTVDIPLGLFVAVTGVSGSGKSTLVTDILYQALARHFYRAKVVPGAHTRIEGLDQIDKVIDIDQSPDRPHAALQPGHVYRAVHARSASCSPSCRTPSCAATDRGASPST